MDYSVLKHNLDKKGVQLVAVSKTKPVEMIRDLYDRGQRIFGENRAQELVTKQPLLPSDIEWHMIGHLQTNKVKQIAPFVSMIHSIDSMKLLRAVNKEGVKNDRVIDVLLQFKIGEEESKYGFDFDDLIEELSRVEIPNMHGVNIRGVMGMASFVMSTKQIRAEFQTLKQYFDLLAAGPLSKPDFNIISMGMSGDYEIAIEEGSNMVRIGSLIFGAR